MINEERRATARILEREASYLAGLAAQAFGSVWAAKIAQASSQAFVPVEAPGLHGEIAAPSTPDEAISMMQEGFKRLSGVVVLSVLVDEPGLVADDLAWLHTMLGARHINIGGDEGTHAMLEAYVHACASVLSAEQVALLRDIVDRAVSLFEERRRVAAEES